MNRTESKMGRDGIAVASSLRIGLIAAAAALALLGGVGVPVVGAQPAPPSEPTQSPGQPKLQEALRALAAGVDDDAVAQSAEAALRAAIEADSTLEEAHYNLVVLMARRGAPEQATAALDAMKATLAGRALTVAAEGLIAETRGDVARADSLYRKALEIERTTSIANVFVAGKALRERRWDDAIRHARLALVGDPGNVNAYLALATAYLEMGLTDLAQLVCLNAASLAPGSAPLHNLLGLVQLAKDDLRAALASFNKAIASDPGYLSPYLNAGALTLGYSDFTSALRYFDSALEIDSSHRSARLSRAVALRGLERFDEAEAAYEALVQGGADAFDARYNLCILHNEYTSQYQRALEVCEALHRDLPSDHAKKEELASRVQGIRTTLEALKGGG